MSGGAAPSGSGILVRAQELREAEERVVKARGRLEALEHEQVARRAARETWRARTRELEIKEHELRLLQEQVGSSNAARVRFFFFDPPRFVEANKCVGRDSSGRA